MSKNFNACNADANPRKGGRGGPQNLSVVSATWSMCGRVDWETLSENRAGHNPAIGTLVNLS
ncbi:MAG: hypothetical protein ACREIA_23345, partial [Opitutaceae bacterium]